MGQGLNDISRKLSIKLGDAAVEDGEFHGEGRNNQVKNGFGPKNILASQPL